MNKHPSYPPSEKEKAELEKKKKIEEARRMHPPTLSLLKEKPTEKEINIDRSRPLDQRKYYPFSGVPTHKIIYRSEDEIKRFAGIFEEVENNPVKGGYQKAFLDTSIPVTAPSKTLNNSSINQKEETSGKVGAILRGAGRVAKAATKIIPKGRKKPQS